MPSDKPTQTASELFDFAMQSATRATQKSKPETAEALTAHSIYCIAQGLKFLSTGLRATYIKLESVEALIKNQRN